MSPQVSVVTKNKFQILEKTNQSSSMDADKPSEVNPASAAAEVNNADKPKRPPLIFVHGVTQFSGSIQTQKKMLATEKFITDTLPNEVVSHHIWNRWLQTISKGAT